MPDKALLRAPLSSPFLVEIRNLWQWRSGAVPACCTHAQTSHMCGHTRMAHGHIQEDDL